MGIVKEEHVAFNLSDDRNCRIEENIGGEIHVHVGKVRIDMTSDELLEFSETLQEAREELYNKKGWN